MAAHCGRVAAAAMLCAGATAVLPWLKVRPVDMAAAPNSARKFIIADEYDREVTLRGVCVEAEERNLPGPFTQRSMDPIDYANGNCPSNYNGYEEPPICEVGYGSGKYNQSTDTLSQNDFAQIRALGFNVVRLCLSWSELEYTPGVYNSTYIDRVEQIVDWAEEQDIYVIIDMHEDLYSQYIYPLANETNGIPPILTPSGGAGNDGAPPWAIETDGWPSWAVLGIGQLNLAMMVAFQHFFDNSVLPNVPQGQSPGPGIQDHYIGAIAALAQRFVNRSTVVGYEVINEPEVGTTIDPFSFADNYLYPLHRRVVQAVTGERDGMPTCPYNDTGRLDCAYPDLGIHDTKHLFFLEPSAVRNLLDFSPQISKPFTNYSQIVHTPHTYTHVFTIDRVLLNYGINISSWYPPSFEFAYQTAWGEANAMNAAVFVTEFGTSPGDDQNTMVHTLDAQDAYMTGATLWSWKSNCVSSTPDGCNGGWTVYFPTGGNVTDQPIAQNGALDPERAWLLSRTHVRGAVGELIAYSFNRTTRSFYATANVTQAAFDRLLARNPSLATLSSQPAHSVAPAAAQQLQVTVDSYRPSLSQELIANGTVTEVYIPPSIPFPVYVGGPARVVNIVTWPDGSRSAYVAPTAAGVYTVFVENTTTTTTAATAMTDLAAAADEDATGSGYWNGRSAAVVAALTSGSSTGAARPTAAINVNALMSIGAAGEGSGAQSVAPFSVQNALLDVDRVCLGNDEEALKAAPDAQRAACASALYFSWLQATLKAGRQAAGLLRSTA